MESRGATPNATVTVTADFDLGGIVSTADRRFLLTAQGTTGRTLGGCS